MKVICIKDFNSGVVNTNVFYIPTLLFKRGEMYDCVNKISSTYRSGYYGVKAKNNTEEVFNSLGFRDYFIKLSELRMQKLDKINESR